MSTVQSFRRRFHPSRVEKSVKHSIGSLLGVFLRKRNYTPPSLTSIRNVLVVRQHNQLGDMLCVVPLLRALRENLAESYISLVASPVNYEVMLNNPFVDEVILYDKAQFFRSPRRFFKFYRKLRERPYDLAIVPSTVSMSFTSDSMAYLSGATWRVGAGSINGIENIASHFFTLPLDLDWKKNPRLHQTERNLEFGRQLGVNTEDFSVVIQLTEEERRYAEGFLREHSKGKRYLIGTHPGAGKPPNRWPAERFAHVAERLAAEFDSLIIITSGPMDEEPVQRMIKVLDCPHVVVKEKSIRRVAAIIDRLSLYITNDTGAMHVSGATSTSVLSLFGPSDPHQWAPRGDRHKFLTAKSGDITEISEEEVYSAAVELLRCQ